MILDQKFPLEEDRLQAKEDLRQLITSRGWVILKEYLQEQVERIEDEILTRQIKEDEILKLWNMQDNRFHYKTLIRKPEELIEELGGKELEVNTEIY